jgi:hypothetical protein
MLHLASIQQFHSRHAWQLDSAPCSPNPPRESLLAGREYELQRFVSLSSVLICFWYFILELSSLFPFCISGLPFALPLYIAFFSSTFVLKFFGNVLLPSGTFSL